MSNTQNIEKQLAIGSLVNNSAEKIKIGEQNIGEQNIGEQNIYLNQKHHYAKYSFEVVGEICHISQYSKYWIIPPAICLLAIIINNYILNINWISLLSTVLGLLFFYCYIIRTTEHDMLKHKGFCYTKSGKLYVLLFDSNYVVEYRVKGKCSMQGCNHQLYFTKVIENEEGHACAIGCSNTPSHFFRFNLPQDHMEQMASGERITLTPVSQ